MGETGVTRPRRNTHHPQLVRECPPWVGWGLPRLGRHFCQKSDTEPRVCRPSLRFSSLPPLAPSPNSSPPPGQATSAFEEVSRGLPSLLPLGSVGKGSTPYPPLPPPSVLNPLRVFQGEPPFPQAGKSTAASSVLLPFIKIVREKPLSDSSVCFWHPGTNPVLAPPVLRAGRTRVLLLPSGSENGWGRLALSPSGTAGQLGDAGLRSAPPSGAETGWVDSGAAPSPPFCPKF